jgi:IclR family acetate operon transcriptional repressor
MEFKGTQSLDQGLALFAAIVRDDGLSAAATIAAALGFAPSSARRTISALERAGMIERIARGRYAGSERLAALTARIDPYRRLIEAARPVLRRIAKREGATAHCGIFDGDMVTYLVKEGGTGMFTRERGQLEAYCTGIGKVLLAQLSPAKLDAYMRGSFVKLTERTLADPDALRSVINAIRIHGYAVDDREMAEDVACVAVPIEVMGRAVAAISISGNPSMVRLETPERLAGRLAGCAREIAARLQSIMTAPQIQA